MSASLKLHNQTVKLMGNQFNIGVVHEDNALANRVIEKGIEEIKRIETVFTTFSETSITNLINNQAGIKPVVVPEEVFSLIERSISISNLTQGAFDITYGGLDASLWNFDKNMNALPSKEVALRSIHLIDYKKILLDKTQSTVYLAEKGMKIGFGGIGKGYAAERAKAVMKHEGAKNGLVNASGDITAWGLAPDGKPWTIGIVNPDLKQHVFSTLQITDSAVATSGNYEKYVLINGVKYSHTIDPKTGYPIRGIKSVTTICPNAEFADAIATPIMVMGVEKGLFLVNQIKGLECIIIDDQNQLFYSKNIHIK